MEIRPRNLGKVKFRVGQLPHQVVGKALLAACTDQKIWIRDSGGVEVALKTLLRQFSVLIKRILCEVPFFTSSIMRVMPRRISSREP